MNIKDIIFFAGLARTRIKTMYFPFNPIFFITLFPVIMAGCKKSGGEFDASGSFEAREIIVSSEIAGTIVSFPHEEGDQLDEGAVALSLDPILLPFQKEQVESTIRALNDKQVSAQPQIEILEEMIRSENVRLESHQNHLSYLQNEQERIHKLVEADAAVQKDLDDIIHQIDQQEKLLESTMQQIAVLQQQIESHKTDIRIRNRALNSERQPLQVQADMYADQLNRSVIHNPVKGTLLLKYSQKGEYVTPGKALYKIADLSEMTLRAYVTGTQFSELKLGSAVDVFVDNSENGYHQYPGTVTWISDEAEFTPKTIQTKDERAHLVYAVKIVVRNDGRLKIGMYGEVKFDAENQDT